ncbi:MAG: hypothetical protein GF331_21765 [Chitinivibrionales bacterium]|nr:hypothetical protein [Chitinivibrionales bacterium]
MRNSRGLAARLCAASMVVWFPLCAVSQDRAIGVDETYPPAMFKEHGGRLIDVTRLVEAGVHSVNATGDGVTDDSEPIIAAMDWVVDQLKAHYADGGGVHWHQYWVIYFPDGVYRVTRPLVYSGQRVIDPIFPSHEEREGIQKLMLVGQSREATIIQLDDNASGFGGPDWKPVVSFSRFDLGTVFNNMPASMQCRNLTVNTGSGNPGAVGLDFHGANVARLDNLAFVGSGAAGVHIRIGSAHGYYSNIVVDGMDYGVYLEGNTESHPVFEYLTLERIANTAIHLEGISTTFRRVQCAGAPRGVHLVSDGSRQPHLVMVDCEFLGGEAANPFLQLDGGAVFLRSINTAGYGSGVRTGTAVSVQAGRIDEYVSEAPTFFSDARGRSGPIASMALPIEDYPVVPWIGDTAQWACVDDYPGSTDTERITNAMGSGRKVVCFPSNSYSLTATIDVPPSVEQIIGLHSRVNSGGSAFHVNEASSSLLVFNGINISSGQIRQSAPRELLLESTYSGNNIYDSDLTARGTTVHVLNTHGFARFDQKTDNVDVFVRWNNNEKTTHWQFTSDPGCTMVMLGFKSEKTYSVFRCLPGSSFEVLGGVLNRFGDDASPDPVGIYAEDANVSMTMASNGPDRNWNPMVEDRQGGTVKTWPMSHFYDRGWSANLIIPLYASYDTAAIGPPVDVKETRAPATAPARAASRREHVFTIDGRLVTGGSAVPRVSSGMLPAGVYIVPNTGSTRCVVR